MLRTPARCRAAAVALGAVILGSVILGSAMSLQAIEPAADLLQGRLQTSLLTRTGGTITGEGVAWHAAYGATAFVRGARQTQDPAYLDAAVTYFDALIAKLHTSPDGYRGWVGPYIYDESKIADVHIGDAILVNPMLDFALHVLQERPELAARYGAKARAYISLAEHICTKWDARGTWYESGTTGGYVSWDRFLTADHMDAFQTLDGVRNARVSLPFNKNQSLAILHLRLYRLSGDAEHLRRARLIFQTTRSRMSGFDDQFTWNYWEPLYPGDVVSVDPPKLTHWVGTHPYRDYQQGEVAKFVEAYHSGLVFTRADMERLVDTNLHMWDGELEDPQWSNSDVRANRAAVPDWQPPDPAAHGYPRLAGTLWRSLAAFHPVLAQLAGTRADNGNYARLHVLPPLESLDEADMVPEPEGDTPQVTFLNMACALGPAVKAGQRTYLVCKARAPGDLRVELRSADGDQQLEALYVDVTDGGIDGVEGITILPWTADVAPGNYRVRWIFSRLDHREHRDVPITVE